MMDFNTIHHPPPPQQQQLAAATSDGMAMGHGVVNELDAAIFDESLMDNVNSAFPSLPFTNPYEFQDFGTGFEDPFSYSNRQYEPQPIPEDTNQDSPSQELDNKLLGFSAPLLKATLLDDSGQQVDLSSMTAELRGMFFVAEDVFGGESTGRPMELTCYRRNLWQCLGEVTLPRNIAHVVDEHGNTRPVFELAASIRGVESIDNKPAEVISIPWKSGSSLSQEDVKGSSNIPAICPLDLSTGHEVDANRVVLNMSWKRLQFKHATANNGRRKGLQQHYTVEIHLLACTTQQPPQQLGDWLQVAQIRSSPVIVRGRSPRNFDSKKDIQLSAERKVEKRSNSDASSTTIPPQRESVGPQPSGSSLQRYPSIGGGGGSSQHAPSGEWATPHVLRESSTGGQPPPAKKMAMSPTVHQRPPIPAWSEEQYSRAPAKTIVSTSSAAQPPRPSIAGPINLSLSEDERSPNTRSSADVHSPRYGGKAAAAAGPTSSQSPKDDEDMLYEYFPLSVDDWMPPVDAVYRPHVVHHTIVPADLKAQQMKSKMKRYFTAES